MSKSISTKNAPAAIGPYSQAICCGNLLFLSGQLPIDTQTGEITGNTIEIQTRAICENIKSILGYVHLSFHNVIKTTCYLTDLKYFDQFNKIYSEYFVSKPARSCVEVSRLPKDVLCEIEIVAEIQYL